jgi:molybdopterin molybdotransferase
MQRLRAPLAKPVQKTVGLTCFMKGFYDGETVMPLDAQESYRLSSFARANCLVQVDEAITNLGKDEMAEIHLLPV